MLLHGAHKYASAYYARATGDPLQPRALMAKLGTVFILTLCYGQRGNAADKQSPKLNIGLIKVLAVWLKYHREVLVLGQWY